MAGSEAAKKTWPHINQWLASRSDESSESEPEA
jgi:hypothetical protein